MIRILAGLPAIELAERWKSKLAAAGESDVINAYGAEVLLSRLRESFHHIVVHSGLFYDRYPWEWMEEIRRVQPHAEVTVVLDEGVYDSFGLEAVCRLAAALGYRTVPAGSREEEMLDDLAAIVTGRRAEPAAAREGKGLVAAVWPTASKDGATTIAMNTALALASAGRLQVGLIDANLRNPEIRPHLNLMDRGQSHFKLRPKMQTGTLQVDELLEGCTTYRSMPGLHILTGSPRRDTAQDMTPDMMGGLLEAARRAFDITIVDVNAYPDNAATVCTVREADVRWLVTQNNYASYQTSWNEWYNCYWRYCGLQPSDISLIVNRCAEDDKPERIADVLGMPLAGAVPNVGDGLGLQSVHEGVPLYLRPKAEAFSEAVGRLSALLAPGAAAEPALHAKPAAVPRLARWAARFTAMFG
ncbi:AAA family ATPase [Paenibacillus sp. S-38]|uniref:AAA family ATPase n=1 Tax=Paenibacillus sp. S-38 TaxID=3416710 RepID=UPI003CF09D92